jgi:hypothetical protein
MKPYRSDWRGRLAHFINHQPHIVAAGILVPLGLLVWWLTGDWSPLP